MYRHITKHYAETLKSTCKYCHKTPALWHYVGNEKICVHCGTRVYNSAVVPVAGDTGSTRAVKSQ